jgi:hypothetical protein
MESSLGQPISSHVEQRLLHECRARIAWEAGRVEDYQRSLAEVERWFRPTGTPALIAKFDRLAALQHATSPQLSAAPPQYSQCAAPRSRSPSMAT